MEVEIEILGTPSFQPHSFQLDGLTPSEKLLLLLSKYFLVLSREETQIYQLLVNSVFGFKEVIRQGVLSLCVAGEIPPVAPLADRTIISPTSLGISQ